MEILHTTHMQLPEYHLYCKRNLNCGHVQFSNTLQNLRLLNTLCTKEFLGSYPNEIVMDVSKDVFTKIIITVMAIEKLKTQISINRG